MVGKLKDIRIKEFRVQELPDIVLDLGIEAAVDAGLDNIQLRIAELPPLSLGITELPPLSLGVTELPDIKIDSQSDLRTTNKVDTDSKLLTDNKVDLDLNVRVTELPRIDLQFGFRPMRFHLPLNFRFCISLFGHRIIEFETCGEAMVVSEDYRPLESERCD